MDKEDRRCPSPSSRRPSSLRDCARQVSSFVTLTDLELTPRRPQDCVEQVDGPLQCRCGSLRSRRQFRRRQERGSVVAHDSLTPSLTLKTPHRATISLAATLAIRHASQPRASPSTRRGAAAERPAIERGGVRRLAGEVAATLGRSSGRVEAEEGDSGAARQVDRAVAGECPSPTA